MSRRSRIVRWFLRRQRRKSKRGWRPEASGSQEWVARIAFRATPVGIMTVYAISPIGTIHLAR